MDYSILFQPYKIGTMELRNRMVLSPMGTSLASEYAPTDRQIAYYVARAKGTAGLIIIEHTYPQEIGCKSEKSLGLWDENALPQWRRLIDAIHAAGSKVAIEIGHLGSCTDYSRLLGTSAIAPSAVRCPVSQEKTRPVTLGDIAQFKKDYLNSVRLARRAGADAIELHFTNGYFMASWLSGRTNKRTDQYGGNLENRMRFPLEIYEMVRAEVGAEYPILARLAAKEPTGGRGIEETRLIAKALEEAGVDALDINAGSPTDFDWEFPSYFKEQGFLLSDIENIKRAVSIPVIGGGRIVEPRMAAQALHEGRIDLIALGRAQIADPDWGAKIASGDIRGIRRCIGCTRCFGEKEKHGLICSVNPYVGRELEWGLSSPATNHKNTLVIGGGPAGLQAAITAAQRGHKVTLAEKACELGGMIRAACVPPKKWEIGGIISTLAHEATQCGVTILTDTEITADYVMKNHFEQAIYAAGSCPVIPEFIPVSGSIATVTAVDVLLGKEWIGDKVAVIGGGMVGCEVAEFISDYKKEVYIFEMADRIANDVQWNIRDMLIGSLEKKQVSIVTRAAVQNIVGDTICYAKDDMIVEESGFDTVVWAIGLKPQTTVADELKKHGIDVVMVGDSAKVSRLHEALSTAVEKTRAL